MKWKNALATKKLIKTRLIFFKKILKSKYLSYMVFLITLLIGTKIFSLYFNKLDFGDEYDNLVASWLMAKGYVPYRDFFSHHFPLLFFIGAPLELIGHSKFLYRLLMFVFTFGSFIFFFRYLEGIYKYTILPFILLASFGISLYGGQQFADGPIWAFILTAAFFVLLKHDGDPLSKNSTILFTILFVLLLLTSPIHLVALPFLILLHVWLQLRNNQKIKLKLNIDNVKLSATVTLILLALFLIYLISTTSLNQFLENAFSFNSSIYFFRTSKLVTGIELLDVYLNASHEVYIHFYLLAKNEGLALVTFLRAAKFLILPFSLHTGYVSYVKIIFEDLYNNFFSIEMIIALFYFFGIVRFYLNKRLDYVIFLLMFLLPLRLRIDTNTHLAPFYFFSYWLAAFALTFSVSELIQKRRVPANILFSSGLIVLTCIFITKHWYSFNQTAFNSFPKENAATVQLIRKSDTDEKIFVFRDFSASYYFESGKEPYGYFMNFFPWYSESERLKDIFIQNLQSYNGNYLVVSMREWSNFKDKHVSSWRDDYFQIIDARFKISSSSNEDYIFAKK
jgi:hypothetical protein